MVTLFYRFKRTGKRNEIFLATKFGITPEGINGSAEYVKIAVENSLRRLGVDTIDLYYLHVRPIFGILVFFPLNRLTMIQAC